MMSGKIDPSALSLIGWGGREGLEEMSYIYGEKVKQAKILLKLDLDKSLVVPKGKWSCLQCTVQRSVVGKLKIRY